MAELGTAGKTRDQTDSAGLAVFALLPPAAGRLKSRWARSGSVRSGSQGPERTDLSAFRGRDDRKDLLVIWPGPGEANIKQREILPTFPPSFTLLMTLRSLS